MPGKPIFNEKNVSEMERAFFVVRMLLFGEYT
jgi:hypothetical protein